MPACGRRTPGFLKLFLCGRLYMCVFVCVRPQGLLITSGMIGMKLTPYNYMVKQVLHILYGSCSQYH